MLLYGHSGAGDSGLVRIEDRVWHRQPTCEVVCSAALNRVGEGTPDANVRRRLHSACSAGAFGLVAYAGATEVRVAVELCAARIAPQHGRRASGPCVRPVVNRAVHLDDGRIVRTPG